MITKNTEKEHKFSILGDFHIYTEKHPFFSMIQQIINEFHRHFYIFDLVIPNKIIDLLSSLLMETYVGLQSCL